MYVWVKDVCSTLKWPRVDPAQDHTVALFKHRNTPGVLMQLQSRNCWAQTSSAQACSLTDGLVLPLQNSSSSAPSLLFPQVPPSPLERAGNGICWAWLHTRAGSGRRAPQLLNTRASVPATALPFLLKQPMKHFIFLRVKVTDTQVANVNTRHIHENSTELSIYLIKRSSNKTSLGKFKTPFETSRLYTMRLQLQFRECIIISINHYLG